MKLGIANVHGAVYRFEGPVSVFWPGRRPMPGPCCRCVQPEPLRLEYAPSRAEAGVLGVLAGVIGLQQAIETIKVLPGPGEPLVDRLLHFDAPRARFPELAIARGPQCRYCSDGCEFPASVDDEPLCASTAA